MVKAPCFHYRSHRLDPGRGSSEGHFLSSHLFAVFPILCASLLPFSLCLAVSLTHSLISYSLLYIPSWYGLPDGSDNEESACNAGDLGLIPGLGRSPGEGKGYPTPVFWPGEFHWLYSPWGRKGSDTTERLALALKTWMDRESLNHRISDTLIKFEKPLLRSYGPWLENFFFLFCFLKDFFDVNPF